MLGERLSGFYHTMYKIRISIFLGRHKNFSNGQHKKTVYKTASLRSHSQKTNPINDNQKTELCLLLRADKKNQLHENYVVICNKTDDFT